MFLITLPTSKHELAKKIYFKLYSTKTREKKISKFIFTHFIQIEFFMSIIIKKQHVSHFKWHLQNPYHRFQLFPSSIACSLVLI